MGRSARATGRVMIQAQFFQYMDLPHYLPVWGSINYSSLLTITQLPVPIGDVRYLQKNCGMGTCLCMGLGKVEPLSTPF